MPSVKVNKQTVTFYGEKECELAERFAKKAKKEFGSINNGLKELAKRYVGE